VFNILKKKKINRGCVNSVIENKDHVSDKHRSNIYSFFWGIWWSWKGPFEWVL